jgi:hypothetical protein
MAVPDHPCAAPRPGGPGTDDGGDYLAWLGAVLGAAAGPGEAAAREFRQGAAGDAMAPGPLLHALAATAAASPAALDDDEELGVISAARRLQAHAAWLELTALADYALRSEARYAASAARGDRRLHRDGEFAREALGMELNISSRAAADRMQFARDLATRLPATLAGMRAGGISEYKAVIIHRRTCHLSAADAAAADAILAAAAPGIRPESLDRKAFRLARRLDPQYARRVKDDAAARCRVEARQEGSGNASLAGRELDPAQVLALLGDIRAEALGRRDAGAAGTLDQIMTAVYLDRLARRPAPAPSAPSPAPAGGAGAPDAGRVPLPALVNVLVPAGTLLGFSEAMGEANGWLLDPGDSRALVRAASGHPRSRWCVTVVNGSGEAIAHGCAAGRHPWTALAGTGSPAGKVAALLRELNVTLEPIARGSCDHRHREPQYQPSRRLRHLVNARTGTCPAPGCGAQAARGEADHTRRWPDGDTCEHNLSPPCPRHHHAKHAPGWKLEQPEPGRMVWTIPGGRSYETGPTRYET